MQCSHRFHWKHVSALIYFKSPSLPGLVTLLIKPEFALLFLTFSTARMRGLRAAVEVINVISIKLRSCSRAARRMWGHAVLRVTWYVARTCINWLVFVDWFGLLGTLSTAWAIRLRVVGLRVILADWQAFRRKRRGCISRQYIPQYLLKRMRKITTNVKLWTLVGRFKPDFWNTHTKKKRIHNHSNLIFGNNNNNKWNPAM